MRSYFNIRRINGHILVEYALQQAKQKGTMSFGISNYVGDTEGINEYLLSVLQNTHEEKINLKSLIPKKSQSRYSRISKEELIQIQDFLSSQRKDITFKLTTQNL